MSTKEIRLPTRDEIQKYMGWDNMERSSSRIWNCIREYVLQRCYEFNVKIKVLPQGQERIKVNEGIKEDGDIC